MSALSTPSSIYHLLLPHPHQAALLLVADQGSWALPTVTPSEPHFGVVAHLNQTVQTTFGLDVVTLRCLGDDWQPGAEMINSVYELENLSSSLLIFRSTERSEYRKKYVAPGVETLRCSPAKS